MIGTEWSLILFTLLIQAGVGLLLISELTAGSMTRKFGRDSIGPEHIGSNVLSLVLVITGIAISFFHLGSPKNAYLALNNWQSSWLSREILFLIIFTALLAVLSFLKKKKALGSSMNRFIAVLACASGLALLFSMSRLYMLPTVPPWNNLITPIAFFITTLLLGCQIFGLGFLGRIHRFQHFPIEAKDFLVDWSQRTFGRLIQFSLVLIILQPGLALLLGDRFFSNEPVAVAGLPDPHLNSQLGLTIWIALFLIAALLLILLLLRMKKAGAELMGLRFQAYGTFCLILLPEILGRYLFFAGYYRLGV